MGQAATQANAVQLLPRAAETRHGPAHRWRARTFYRNLRRNPNGGLFHGRKGRLRQQPPYGHRPRRTSITKTSPTRPSATSRNWSSPANSLRASGTIYTPDPKTGTVSKFSVPKGTAYADGITTPSTTTEMFAEPATATLVYAFPKQATDWLWTSSANETKALPEPCTQL